MAGCDLASIPAAMAWRVRWDESPEPKARWLCLLEVFPFELRDEVETFGMLNHQVRNRSM